MALRRPPTRIELKADDVEEYDKVRWQYYYSSSFICSRFTIIVLVVWHQAAAHSSSPPLNYYPCRFLHVTEKINFPFFVRNKIILIIIRCVSSHDRLPNTIIHVHRL